MTDTAEPSRKRAGSETPGPERPSKLVKHSSKLYYSARPITVVVGQQKQKFYVSLELLRAESDYFEQIWNSAAAGPTATCNGSEWTLEEHDPQVFTIVLDYLYNDPSFTSPSSPATKSLDSLIDAWFCANQLGMPGCENAIMDSLQLIVGEPGSDQLHSQRLVRKAILNLQKYPELDPATTLYRFFVQRFAYDLRNKADLLETTQPVPRLDEVTSEIFEIGGSILRDIMAYSFARKSTGILQTDPARLNDCTYHEHNEDDAKACPRATKPSKNAAPTPTSSTTNPFGGNWNGSNLGTGPVFERAAKPASTSSLFGNQSTTETPKKSGTQNQVTSSVEQSASSQPPSSSTPLFSFGQSTTTPAASSTNLFAQAALPSTNPFGNSFGQSATQSSVNTQTFGGFGSSLFGQSSTAAGSGATTAFGTSLFSTNLFGTGVSPVAAKRTVPPAVGTLISFTSTVEKDLTGPVAEYQTISMMEHYKDYSVEELRFADYKAGRKAGKPLFGGFGSSGLFSALPGTTALGSTN